ncbi:hypothetical protein STBA_05170 [Streptomyces sp. MP131-18]|nr:hypothetical protein STBA_05170 [Streptomyces sp. MP131-18]
MGGGQFADGVPGQEVGPQPPGREQPVKGDLDGEQRGLGGGRLVQTPPGGDGVGQRVRQVRVERGGHLVERGGVDGEGRVQFPAHPGPLRALAGEQDGQAARFRDAGHQARGGAAGRQGRDALQQARGVGRDGDGPVPEERARGGERPPQIGGGLRRAPPPGGREGREAPGLGAQRGLPRGRDHPGQHGGGAPGPLRGGGPGRRLGDHDVAVGAAHAERADARHQRAVRARPGARRRLHPQAQFVQRDAGVRRLEVEAGGQGAVTDAEQRLDQPGDARRALQVPDVGLDRADGQRLRRGAARTEHRAERGGLDRVADGGAGAVQFHVLDLVGGNGGPFVRRPQHLFLARASWHGEAVRGAVVVDGAAVDDAVHAVPVGQRLPQPFEDEDAAALAGDEAVGPGVERVGDAVGRQRAEPFLGDGVLRQQIQVHAGGQGDRRLAAAQALAGQVDGDERGGLGGVDGQARPAQAQVVGDPPGDDAPVDAGHGVLGDRVGALLVQQGRVVVAQGADEHRGAGVAQGRRYDARVLQCLPGQFEDEPLLRVDRGCLAGGNGEESGVEVADGFEESAPRDGGRCVRPPPVLGNVPHGARAAVQQVPEFRGVFGAREPAGQPDDSNAVVLFRGSARRSCLLTHHDVQPPFHSSNPHDTRRWICARDARDKSGWCFPSPALHAIAAGASVLQRAATQR